MSYTGPDFDPHEPRRPRRVPLAVALAALVAGGLLGWLLYEVTGDSGAVGRPDAAGAVSGTAPGSASRPPSSSTAPSATASPSASHGAGGGDGKPGGVSGGSGGTGPLAGRVVLVDPGHNQGNFRHTGEIGRPVDIGTNRKECDTTGTSTDAGYTEARFTLDLAHRLRALLEAQGATVRMTRDGDSPAWGPCVDERARIGNDAHADAAISLHADGAAAGDRGFHVILPGTVHAGGADTRGIVGPSRELGERVAGSFVRVTGDAPSNYLGGGTGLVTRTDLGGLNLSTVPKVFIECGNMRDSKDAAQLTSGAWRQKAAQGISEGIVSFLRGS
ncbi:N-acetylmuramoyl-L-alanine amidase [Streptomyces tropicalis]|uniref:N-acetylmuramoyl-L-alanine amidase n=1 Tax=Streptomyces tropicalis TaxID=3034234 RepID=A0ABT5ZY04_9ACTN|nr:N-acetylmuramoyl-L-alanine amidase [Streptomyces tropicalis]MDF3297289.1 N-acetylmuramoyl-L-alanine amidase [Streptomyces tropicalis]